MRKSLPKGKDRQEIITHIALKLFNLKK